MIQIQLQSIIRLITHTDGIDKIVSRRGLCGIAEGLGILCADTTSHNTDAAVWLNGGDELLNLRDREIALKIILMITFTSKMYA